MVFFFNPEEIFHSRNIGVCSVYLYLRDRVHNQCMVNIRLETCVYVLDSRASWTRYLSAEDVCSTSFSLRGAYLFHTLPPEAGVRVVYICEYMYVCTCVYPRNICVHAPVAKHQGYTRGQTVYSSLSRPPIRPLYSIRPTVSLWVRVDSRHTLRPGICSTLYVFLDSRKASSKSDNWALLPLQTRPLSTAISSQTERQTPLLSQIYTPEAFFS